MGLLFKLVNATESLDYMILKIRDFTIAEDFKLKVTFNNGETRLVDLSNDLTGEVFEPLKDKDFLGASENWCLV